MNTGKSSTALIMVITLIFSSLMSIYFPDYSVTGADDYSIPVGANWTMDDVVANSGSTVTGKGDKYFIHGNLTIGYGATLTIKPGTTIIFDELTSIIINGALKAEGEENNWIAFTSGSSDPKPRDWNGLIFELRSITNTDSILRYVEITYSNYGVTCRSASPRIENSVITKSQVGIYGDSGSSPIIRDSEIKDNNFWGIRLNRAESEISNCTISENYFGIFSDRSSLNLADNVIENNDMFGILLKNEDTILLRNSIRFNGITSAGLYPGILAENSVLFSDSNEFEGNSHAGIELVNSSVQSINDKYTDNLIGINLTRESSLYADNNEIENSFEHGIRNFDSSLVLKNSNVTDNGWGDGSGNNLFTGIYLNNASGRFEWNYIMRNGFMGIALEGSNAELISNSIRDNNKDGIYCWYSSPRMMNNSFNNSRYNIFADKYSNPVVINFFGPEENFNVVDETGSITTGFTISGDFTDLNGNPLKDVQIKIVERIPALNIDRHILTSAPSDESGKVDWFTVLYGTIYHNRTVEFYALSKFFGSNEIEWGLTAIAVKSGYNDNPYPLGDVGPINIGGMMSRAPEINLTTPESEYSGTIKGTLKLEGTAHDSDSEIVAIYYRSDNNPWHEAEFNIVSGPGYTYEWRLELNTETLTTGGHTIQIKAAEMYHNSTPIEIAIDVDNPLGLTDSDGDSLKYADEIRYGTDPDKSDTDSDGLSDSIEIDSSDGNTTDPLNPDTDSDGINDGDEDRNHNGRVDAGETDPNNPDSDDDGVIDGSDDFPLDPTQSKAEFSENDRTYMIFSMIMVVCIVILSVLTVILLRKTRRLTTDEKKSKDADKKDKKSKNK